MKRQQPVCAETPHPCPYCGATGDEASKTALLAPKAELVHIRLSAAEKLGFREAAELAGLGLSTWIRARLRQMAIRELEGAGKKVPFVSPFPTGSGN